jgi:hypothetical protein
MSGKRASHAGELRAQWDRQTPDAAPLVGLVRVAWRPAATDGWVQ